MRQTFASSQIFVGRRLTRSEAPLPYRRKAAYVESAGAYMRLNCTAPRMAACQSSRRGKSFYKNLFFLPSCLDDNYEVRQPENPSLVRNTAAGASFFGTRKRAFARLIPCSNGAKTRRASFSIFVTNPTIAVHTYRKPAVSCRGLTTRSFYLQASRCMDVGFLCQGRVASIVARAPAPERGGSLCGVNFFLRGNTTFAEVDPSVR